LERWRQLTGQHKTRSHLGKDLPLPKNSIPNFILIP
jgi:hypothetical protein